MGEGFKWGGEAAAEDRARYREYVQWVIQQIAW